MAYDDDDDGPGFLTTALLLSLAAGGAWLLWRTVSASAAAGTGSSTTGATSANPITSLLSSNPLTALATATGPKGVRNNNPGNIKYNPANAWIGQTGQDADGFATFSDPTYGLRAMYILLRSYAGELSPFNIDTIAARWTAGDPSTSQDTWASTVSAQSGIPRGFALDATDPGQMEALVTGIIAAENGPLYLGLYAGQLAQAWSMV